ncbi:MAG: hypothetical protein FWD15_04090 [Alphaproteobacteria bacterium]|nr:hypothetical protein [Alphaproteobacteria bacterium]
MKSAGTYKQLPMASKIIARRQMKILYEIRKMSMEKIAIIYGLHQKGVEDILLRQDTKIRTLSEAKCTDLTQAEIDARNKEIGEDYEIQKMSISKIAKKFKLNTSSVHHILTSILKIKLRTKSEAGNLFNEKIAQSPDMIKQNALIRELYDVHKLSAIQISDMLGISETSIYKTVKRGGIIRRSLVEASASARARKPIENHSAKWARVSNMIKLSMVDTVNLVKDFAKSHGGG